MIKNTTLTPHRSLYIPNHSQFALGIIGKYQFTTDNYLGILGLTFRENLGSETLDTAPIYQYLVHLRLQILQLQHANNHFMGLRSTTLQMLHQKINTNIELYQINQLLNQHETSYSNNSTRNNSITIQMIDRRSQISQMLSTPAYGHSIHFVEQTNGKRTIRLVDLRMPMKEREGTYQSSTVYKSIASTNHVHLSKLYTQIWNPFLERTFKRESNRLLTKYIINDNSQTVTIIKSLVQIDPIPPIASHTWKPGKPTIEIRRHNTKLIDINRQNSKEEQTSSNFFFPAAINFNTLDNFFNHQTTNNSSETLNSNYFSDSAANSKVMNSYLKNYNSAFGSTFVQYIVNKLSQTSMNDELSEATNFVLIDRSLIQRGFSSTNELWNDNINLLKNNRNTSIRNKRMLESSDFVQFIIKKQAYSQNESNEFYTTNEYSSSLLPRLQLIERNPSVESGSITNPISSTLLQIDHILLKELNSKSIHYKNGRLNESIHFVNSLIHKREHSTATSSSKFREKTTQTVKLKPYFLYTDTNSQVFQQFRLNLIQSKQLFEALLQPDSPVQPANRYFVNRIVQEHLIVQSEVVQLIPQQLEHQSLLNNNFADNAQFDLNFTMYNNMNSMQLVDRNYSTNLALNEVNEVNRIYLSQPLLLSEVTLVKAFERKLISLRSSLSPGIFQKFSLTQNHIQLGEYELKRALMNVQANTVKSTINKQSLIEQMVQAHINNWSAQIQFLPTPEVNHLLNQVENEFKSSFNEMNVNSAQNYKQSLTLVDRKVADNSQLLTASAGHEQLPLLLQSREIVQKAAFLKQKVRELQEVNNDIKANIKFNKAIYLASNLANSSTQLQITKSSVLNSNLMQQLWLNNQILHQAAVNLNTGSIMERSELTAKIIRDRIGDIAHVIQLNSKQVNNQLLLQTHYYNEDLSSNVLSAADLESGFIHTHLIKLVDRKLIDRDVLNKTLVIKQQQTNLHKTNLQTLIQHYQSLPVKLSIELKQLDSIVNTYRNVHSGQVTSLSASLSPLIYEKYSIHLLDNQKSVKPLKRSLGQVNALVGVPLELSVHLFESNNLIEKIVNERIHSLSSLILQLPLSATNLLLHQLNMDTYSKVEIEKQLHHTNNQQRLELVDRKVIERGGVITNSSSSLLVSLDNSYNQQNERLLLKYYNQFFQDRFENSTQSTSYLQLNLTDKIIRERIGEVSSILQLNQGHVENLLFYAVNPIMSTKEKKWLDEERSGLRLMDRKKFDRGIEAAMTVIMLQQGAEQRATKQFLINSSNELNGNLAAILQSVPILRQVIRQLRDYTTGIHSNRGPVVSFLTSLSPIVYQKFWYRNQPIKQAPEQQLKRHLSQFVQVEQAKSTSLHYRENLTEKIVRERVDEMTHSAHLMALTNTNQISTQAHIQMISQAQKEQEKPLSAIESIGESTSLPRPQLLLVDRNHIDSNTVQLSAKETRLTSSAFRSAETHLLFRELLTKKVVKSQINDLLTQTEHPVTMQSLQKDQINQKFIEKVTTQLLIANERKESNETLLINRRNNQDVEETVGTLSVLRAQSEATLDYLKAKSNAAEPIQQSVANILQQKDPAASGEAQNLSKVTPITKLEFDKIVDRVYKELQKRFTYERQRRGM